MLLFLLSGIVTFGIFTKNNLKSIHVIFHILPIRKHERQVESMTETEIKTFSQAWDDIKKDHPKKYWTMIVISTVLFISLLAKSYYLLQPVAYHADPFVNVNAQTDSLSIVVNNNRYTSLTWHYFRHYLDDLDIGGLVAGLLGIVIGLFLTIEIKRREEKKDRELEIYKQERDKEQEKKVGDLKKIADDSFAKVKEVEEHVQKLLAQYEKLKTSSGYRQLLEDINAVIKKALSGDYKLNIANHTAAFGYFLCFDLDVVLKHAGLSRAALNGMSCVNYHYLHLEARRFQKEMVADPLLLSADKLREKMAYATLKTMNGHLKGPFYDFYLEKTLSDKIVIPYDEHDSGVLISDWMNRFSQDCAGKTVYLVPSEFIKGRTIEEARTSFAEYLVKDQTTKINALQKRGAAVHRLDEINLQMFVCSRTTQSHSDKRRSLFMFVNQQTIGKTQKENELNAFTSEDPSIVDTLETIFRDTVMSMNSGGEMLVKQLFRDFGLFSEPIADRIMDISTELKTHPLYSKFSDKRTVQKRIRTYMEYQVWCVWDFMALLKSIQQKLIPTSIAWTPPEYASLGRYLYDVLRTEETDVSNEPGKDHASHFEAYLNAMQEAGADIEPISDFIAELKKGIPVDDAIAMARMPEPSREFVTNTMKHIKGKVHESVAVFCLSREGIIPEMFTTFTESLVNEEGFTKFRWYLDRHIELDSSSHGPLSVKLFKTMVGNDKTKLYEALDATLNALQARKNLLDAINTEVIKTS